jgi:hypothetical protein
MARQTRRKIKRRQASRRRSSRRASRRALQQKQRGGGGEPAAAPPELPDEITVELDAYTPYYVKSCQAKTAEGKWVSIHHVDPDTNGAFIDDDMLATADEIVKKVVDEKELAGQSDGFFTYFVYQNQHVQNYEDPEAIRIGCIKVRSGLEFGTSHMNLADYLRLLGPESFDHTRTANLLFAGEFKKEGENITYNFLSGTFLQKHDNALSPAELALTRSQRVEVMKALLGKMGLVGIFTDESFITPETPFFTMEEKADLERIGLLINEFDTKRQCKDYSPPEEDDDEDEDDDD